MVHMAGIEGIHGLDTWKKGWFPDHTSTTYFSFVPLTVMTSSPLQNTWARIENLKD
jgi:hypothetical protein